MFNVFDMPRREAELDSKPVRRRNHRPFHKVISPGLLFFGAVCLSPYLLMTLPFFWVMMAQPFDGFTFTDLVDFGPISLIATMAVLLFLRVPGSAPRSERWDKGAKIATMLTSLLFPAPMLVYLYALSFRASQLIGHSPQSMINDPKWIGTNDAYYQDLRHKVNYAFAYSGALAWISVLLMVHLWPRLSKRRRLLFLVLFMTGSLVLFGDGRFSWWLD